MSACHFSPWGGGFFNQANAQTVINAGETVTITQDMSGYSDKTTNGAAISNSGTLILTDSASLTLNEAKYGGAIANMADMTIQNNVNISSNSATYGGGIYNSKGDLKIIDSTLSGNEVNAGSGGAIWSNNFLTITNSKLNNNIANESTTSNGRGGAIYNSTNGNAVIYNSEFKGNEAYNGGAIYNYKYGSTANTYLTINGDSTVFSGNIADYMGGVIYNSSGIVTVNDKAEFTGNKAEYGGVFVNSAAGTITINNESTYSENTASQGGVIYNQGNLNIQNGIFSNNSAEVTGGVIRTVGTTSDTQIKNAAFEANYAGEDGGAISMGTTGVLTIDNSTFTGNHTDYEGGALMAELPVNTGDSILTVTNSTFSNNYTKSAGGAVGNFTLAKFTDTKFTGNYTTSTGSTSSGGGAFFFGAHAKTTLDNVTFENNNSASRGGAIATRSSEYDCSDAKLEILNSTFTGNTANTTGGALDNWFFASDTHSDAVYIYNSTFEENKAKSGGAIYNHEKGEGYGQDGAIIIENVNFTKNTASENGGAVYNETENITITDASFTDNTAGGNGGAIYTTQDITINAENKDITFSGNTASDGSDIYMEKESGNINLNASAEKTITLSDGVSGNSGGYNILVNKDSINTGSVIIESAINNAVIDTQNGTLHLSTGSELNNTTVNMTDNTSLNTINNQVDNYGDKITIGDNVKIAIDVNVGDKTSDSFANSTQNGSVILENINIIGRTYDYDRTVTIDLAQTTGLNDLSISDEILSQTFKILTPIRYMQGSVNSNAILHYGPIGNSYNDFNPAVMAAPIAAQMGGYLAMLNSYDEAFRNMDMYMLMTQKQRQALKYANKYAASDSNLVFSQINTPYTDTAGWFRPFATFESVGLKNGPKVNNVAYGTYAGLESEMFEFKNGWDGIISLYAGYNGSHQTYQGNSIYQNGGTLGLVGMAYKGNFFTGLTVNAGANVGEANTMYGSEDFTMFMSGVASKSGYNFELADGKFIIQPNYLMSYSFVNTFDYTNAAGVRINSDPLHAIQIEPGLKFIGNLNNGWQPYAGLSVVLNIMDKTQFKANDVSLPELSVKPYAKYGVGIRKTWGERFTGFLQAFITSGGRNGIGLQTGFRWTLGKNPSHILNQVLKKHT